MPHPAHRFAEWHLFRPGDRYRLARKPVPEQSGFEDADEVRNSQGAKGLIPEADERKHWKAMQGMTQVVEHVVAASVDHPRFHHRVIEPCISHDLFRRPL